jgi:glucose/mannose-6-phosphate isomerase
MYYWAGFDPVPYLNGNIITLMILDDPLSFMPFDTQNLMEEIHRLPDQLEKAWKSGLQTPLPGWQGIQNVIIAGMGGSAIAADLLCTYLLPTCKVPIFVQRDYGLPSWARGPETLMIACSHSGDTEETLDAFENGITNNCRVMSISTGGKLTNRSKQVGAPAWLFEHKGQPRSAVGFSFGMLLAVITRLGLAPNPESELVSGLYEMRSQQKALEPQIPADGNPAIRLAGQLMGRWVNVIGSGILAPVARRWKCQINEMAKAGAGFDFLPEADHNTLAGLSNPEVSLGQTATIFLNNQSDHPRNQLRTQLTRQTFLQEGLSTHEYIAPGLTRLAQQWCGLHFGDYLAFYLAMLYQEDPTPIPAIQELKQRMG